MNFKSLCTIAAVLCASAGVAHADHHEKQAAEPAHAYKTVTLEEVKAAIASKSSVIVDSRKEEEYAKGHIDTAVSLPADQVSEESLKKIAEDKNASLIFYCGNVKCPASAKSAEKAHELGYTNVHKFPGGWEEWSAKK